MGNSRSQVIDIREGESFYEDFHEPYGSPNDFRPFDEVDEESELTKARLVTCPQCGERYSTIAILHTDNSACQKCMNRLRTKGKWTQSKDKPLNFRGQQLDSRFPQAVSWNFGSHGAPPKQGFQSNITSNSVLPHRRGSDAGVNRTFKQKPMPMSNRQVLDRMYQPEDIELQDEEIPRRVLRRRDSVLPPAFFKMVINAEFRPHSYQRVASSPNCFCLVDGNIWCGQENEITAWTTDFTPVEFEENQQYELRYAPISEIQSICQLKSGKIIVAGGSGIHMLTSTGRYEGCISQGVYTNVSAQDHTLYACLFGSVTRAKLQVYDETVPWELLRTISLPCDGAFSAYAWEKVITVCNSTHGGLYVLDNSGNMLQKCALKLKHGGLGQFNEPRICQSGMDGTILIADKQNGYIQARTVTGDFGLVKLEIPIDKPGCAFFYKKQLFIGQGSKPYKIYKCI